jgi:HSP20 family molecular chaperone IbpA
MKTFFDDVMFNGVILSLGDLVYSYNGNTGKPPEILHYDKNEIVLQLLVAGAFKEDINVFVRSNLLVIDVDTTKRDWIDEKFRLKFKKEYKISPLLDSNTLEVKLVNGILEIKIKTKKQPEELERKININ